MHDAAGDIATLEHNLWSMFSVLGRGEGGHVHDTPTRLVIATPVLQAPYNGVWRFYDEGDRPLEQQVKEVLEPLIVRGAPAVWIVHPTSPYGLRDALMAAGLEHVEELLGMSADLGDLAPVPAPPEGVQIMEATATEADAWLHLVTWRYGLDTTASPYLRDIYARAIGTHTRMWLASIDGEPVSKAAMHIADGVAGIYAVATTEHGQRRGLARMLTLAALNAARAQGIRRSVLHATPMAVGLYRGLGYREVAPFEVWAEPGKLHL